MKNKLHIIILLIGIGLLLFSCKRKEPTRWNIDATVPIAQGRLSVDKILPDSFTTVDTNGLVHFLIQKDLTNFNMDSLVTLPDTSFYDYYPSAISFAAPANFPLIPGNLNQSLMNIKVAEITELISKSGEMYYRLKNFVGTELLATYALPLVTLDGESVYIEEFLPPGTYTNPSIVEGTFDLSGYHFDLSGVNGDANNTMTNQVSLSTVESFLIPSQDTLFVADLGFVNATIAYAKGYFGQHDFDIKDTIDITVLNKIIEGGLDIDKIDVNLKVENTVGIDGQINFGLLTSENTNEATVITLDNPDLFNTINLTRAFDDNGVITPSTFELNMNEINSNIDEFIEVLPNRLTTDVSMKINPLGDISLGNDFIYTDFPLTAFLEIDMPLCVKLDNITILDTIDFTTDLEFEDTGELTLYIDNSFPFETTFSATVINVEGEEVLDLIDSQIIQAGIVLDSAFEILEGHSVIKVPINSDVVSSLKENDRVSLQVVFNTVESEFVKISSSNYIDVKITGQAQTEISYD